VCFHCEQGKYAPAVGADGCVACAPGSFSGSGRPGCDHCPAGKFQQLAGQYRCTACAVNLHQPGTGTTACLPCAYCTVTDREGAAVCRSDKTHCAVSVWTAWAPCSATCAEGGTTRSRTVTVPSRCGGDPCAALTEAGVCFLRACDCAKLSCKFEHHDCTTYYDRGHSTLAGRRVLVNNKLASTAFRTHRDPEASEYSSKGGTYTLGGWGVGPADGSAAAVTDAHSAVRSCHNQTSVRVYHSAGERWFNATAGAGARLPEGHHCKILAAGPCACRCHAKFRHNYNPKFASSFDSACGMVGLACDSTRVLMPTPAPGPTWV
jgi:hypothetical protein